MAFTFGVSLPPEGDFPPLMSVFRVGGGGGNAVNWVMSLAFPQIQYKNNPTEVGRTNPAEKRGKKAFLSPQFSVL